MNASRVIHALAGLITVAAATAQAQSAENAVSAEQPVVVAVPAQAAPAAVAPQWTIRLPASEAVDFRGMANFDAAGSGAGSMAYPAVGGLAGLVVGVLAHAAINESVKSAEKTRIQEAADRVLADYRDVLAKLTHRDLIGKGLAASSLAGKAVLMPTNQDTLTDWVLDLSPVYYMTQDQTALVLDTQVLIRRRGALDDEAYRNTVRVVAKPVRDVEVLAPYWKDVDGSRLRALTVDMLAHSVDIASKDAQKLFAASTAPARTIRYAEGKAEKMERGQVIDDCCERVVLRNLRGWLMSVPPRASASASPAVAP